MKRVILALAATFALSACLDSPSGVGEPETPPDPPMGTNPVAAAQASTTRDLPATGGFDGQVHAFTWHPSTGMVRLNAGGATQSRALAINSWGDVVGILNDNELVAWVWEQNLHRWQ